MPHPLMYDDRDPHLVRLREVCATLPASFEKVAHGRPTFRAGEKGKVFAYYGAGVKTPTGHVRHDAAVLVKPDAAEGAALDADPRFFLPAYLASAGWRGLDLDADDTDWDEVRELVETSYRQVAPRALIAELDRP